VNSRPVIELEDPFEIGLTGPGNDEGTGRAPVDQVAVADGQEPATVGTTVTEPGGPDVVAQLMAAEVCVRSVTYGALVRLAANPL
jgi:hypothetical protein